MWLPFAGQPQHVVKTALFFADSTTSGMVFEGDVGDLDCENRMNFDDPVKGNILLGG